MTTKKGFFGRMKIGVKMIFIFSSVSIAIILAMAIVSYVSGSNSISHEAKSLLAATAELKTTSIEKFLHDRYGDVHVMTGVNVLKRACDKVIGDINNSNINPNISIREKRKALYVISPNYRIMSQYIAKYQKALPNFNEIKYVALYPLRNKAGAIVFNKGDQVLSANDFDGNVSKRNMSIGAHKLIKRFDDGVESKKYECPFLFSSSIEYCSELKRPSIHLSHPMARLGISMNKQRINSAIEKRFSLMMIFDVKIETINYLLADTTGMGTSGESYLVENIHGKITMLTNSRHKKDTALKEDLSHILGIKEHLKRSEFHRGKKSETESYCLNPVYENYIGYNVLAHNHMIKIGKNKVGLITEIKEGEVFQGVTNLMIIMIILGVIAIMVAVVAAVFFARSIANPLKFGVQFAETIADSDLTAVMDKELLERGDEIGDLSRAMNKMSGDLKEVISNITISSQNLSQAVQQIASGNENLSQRTSEQASSLEEIASTIEETTATINQNADNSLEANKLSNGSKELAKEGSMVVEDAVKSINDINDSSKKIGEITAVINEISFQTNLLALNAAVEAARAGEQGRGFAVVAGEVRNLAQRSANAAKEIENLIMDSINLIATGTELSNKSGEALKEVNISIENVSQIIEEVTAASQEQKQGMSQINIAVTELDSMTQQNSALVEETASAGEEMANQAQELLAMVKRFKIDEGFADIAKTSRKEIHLKSLENNSKKSSSLKKSNDENKKQGFDVNKDSTKDSFNDSLKKEGFEEF